MYFFRRRAQNWKANKSSGLCSQNLHPRVSNLLQGRRYFIDQLKIQSLKLDNICTYAVFTCNKYIVTNSNSSIFLGRFSSEINVSSKQYSSKLGNSGRETPPPQKKLNTLLTCPISHEHADFHDAIGKSPSLHPHYFPNNSKRGSCLCRSLVARVVLVGWGVTRLLKALRFFQKRRATPHHVRFNPFSD